MWNTVKLMFTNWKTAIPGLLAVACGGSSVMGVIPEPYQEKAGAVCGLLLAFGLIAAKDADKSNAPAPTSAPNAVK